MLAGFLASAAGTLDVQVYGWADKRRILVAHGSKRFASGAEHRLRVRSTKKGRKLLRRPQQTRIRVVVTYTDQGTGRESTRAGAYKVKPPKANKSRAKKRQKRPPGRHRL